MSIAYNENLPLFFKNNVSSWPLDPKKKTTVGLKEEESWTTPVYSMSAWKPG